MSKPGGPWSARDRGLAEALIAFEASTCSGCGQPVRLAWDPRTEGEWEAVKHTCEACKARASATADGQTKPAEHITVHRITGPA